MKNNDKKNYEVATSASIADGTTIESRLTVAAKSVEKAIKKAKKISAESFAEQFNVSNPTVEIEYVMPMGMYDPESRVVLKFEEFLAVYNPWIKLNGEIFNGGEVKKEWDNLIDAMRSLYKNPLSIGIDNN